MDKKIKSKSSKKKSTKAVMPSIYDAKEFSLMEQEYEKYVLRIKNLSRGIS